MHQTRTLMDAISGGNQRDLVLVHKTRPALHHDDDLKLGDMVMPALAILRRKMGLYQMGDDFAVGRFGYSEVAIEKEIPQAAGEIYRIVGFDLRKQRPGFFVHGAQFMCQFTHWSHHTLLE